MSDSKRLDFYMNNTSNNHILIIEDDLKFAEIIKTYLVQQGFNVCLAKDGRQGLDLASELKPQLIILNLMLSHVDGLTVCRELQKCYQNALLILSASGDDMDQVAALEMGADDFVLTPIHPRVLLARVRALLRRSVKVSIEQSRTSEKSDDVLVFDNLRINLRRRQVEQDNIEIKLTETEFELLWLFASNPEQVLSRDQISKSLRGIEYDGLGRAVDNKIVSLRKKLGGNGELSRKIITVRGKGYIFVTAQ